MRFPEEQIVKQSLSSKGDIVSFGFSAKKNSTTCNSSEISSMLFCYRMINDDQCFYRMIREDEERVTSLGEATGQSDKTPGEKIGVNT